MARRERFTFSGTVQSGPSRETNENRNQQVEMIENVFSPLHAARILNLAQVNFAHSTEIRNQLCPSSSTSKSFQCSSSEEQFTLCWKCQIARSKSNSHLVLEILTLALLSTSLPFSEAVQLVLKPVKPDMNSPELLSGVKPSPSTNCTRTLSPVQ